MRYVNMASPTLRDVLERAGKKPLQKLPVIRRVLNLSSMLEFKQRDTAEYVISQLEQYEPTLLSKSVQEIINPEDKSKSKGHMCVTNIMVLAMILMSVGFFGANIYIAIHAMKIIPWQDMLVPLIGPVFLVWYDRGLLRKENRDVIAALMGKPPAMTFLESVTNRIGRSRDYTRYDAEHSDMGEVKDTSYNPSKGSKYSDY